MVGRMMDRRHMTVLLLEDQPLIAMDTESMLKRIGFERIVHFGSVTPALAWIATSMPDFAILEVTLQDQPSVAIAQQLISRNVPFLVYSGANRAMVHDRVFQTAAWISKPSEIESIEPTISRVLGTA
jgi:DNA-binding NarL/FixJ family response regulator